MAATEAAPITFQIAAIISSTAGVAVIIALWITREFSKNRQLFFRVMSRHNREDDDRFAHLDDQQWSIIVRNAIKDGIAIPHRKTIPRRRYLMDDMGDEVGDGAELEPAE